jgi:uncharacterized protein YkwD
MGRLSSASFLVVALGLSSAVVAGPEEAVLTAVNAARAKAGCAPLKINAKLAAAARSHARAMAEKNFFAHTGKDGSRLPGRIDRQGYSYRSAAENIAAGQETAREVVRSWLQSAGHRQNILDCGMRETGIALVYQANDRPIQGSGAPLNYYWVQVFADPA